ncbi:restriction endonuclease subunit S [Priestia megaterium]|uniref:restriction endonuclease subunit S n=1 Tax=Priestia megaterium TaxID=1404 RepID=UPI0028574813|nr:restriction endonuclease subunit S [Priestia megaterium]MDR7244244.1 type I restriction enzyme S subunit [Priestia megaterium]
MSKRKKTIEELLEGTLASEEERPYEVPDNWLSAKFNSVLKISSGKSLTKKQMNEEGDIPVFGGNGITGIHDQFNVNEETIVIGRVGFYCGSVHLTPKKAWVTDNAFIVYFSESIFDKNYLYWTLKHLNLRQYSNSSAQPVISGKTLSHVTIKIPPLDEQKRIVNKVERLLNKIEDAKQLTEEAKETFELRRAAILDKALRGELTVKWRKDNKNIDSALDQIEEYHMRRVNEYKLNKSKKPEYLKHNLKDVVKQDSNLPDGWVVSPVGFLCDCIVPGRDKPKSFTGDIPWVTIPDIINDEIYDNQSKLSLSQQEIEEVNAKVIPENSVIMSCVGRFGISTVVKKPIVINQQLHAFLPSELVLPKYLMYHIKILKKYMNSIATSTTIAYLNKTNANSLPINLPPIEEQGAIVEILESLLSKLDAQETLIGEMDENLETLRQSILSKAFRGELGTNEPSEESAIELLQEILQEQVK